MRGEPFNFPFPWGYQLAIGRWRDRGYLQAYLVTLGDSDLGLRLFDYCWVRLGQPVRRDAAYSSRRVGRHLRYVWAKVSFGWWILNSFVAGLFAYRASVLLGFPQGHCSSQCWDGEDGAGWWLLGLIGLVFIYLLVESKIVAVVCVDVRMLYVTLSRILGYVLWRAFIVRAPCVHVCIRTYSCIALMACVSLLYDLL
jgi:hypothetical protein